MAQKYIKYFSSDRFLWRNAGMELGGLLYFAAFIEFTKVEIWNGNRSAIPWTSFSQPAWLLVAWSVGMHGHWMHRPCHCLAPGLITLGDLWQTGSEWASGQYFSGDQRGRQNPEVKICLGDTTTESSGCNQVCCKSELRGKQQAQGILEGQMGSGSRGQEELEAMISVGRAEQL